MLLGWLFWAEGSQTVPSQHPPAMLSSGAAAPEQRAAWDIASCIWYCMGGPGARFPAVLVFGSTHRVPLASPCLSPVLQLDQAGSGGSPLE